MLGSSELKNRLWIVGLGMWDCSLVGTEEILCSDLYWIKLAMNRVERVLV
jgi:hypothetical protein